MRSKYASKATEVTLLPQTMEDRMRGMGTAYGGSQNSTGSDAAGKVGWQEAGNPHPSSSSMMGGGADWATIAHRSTTEGIPKCHGAQVGPMLPRTMLHCLLFYEVASQPVADDFMQISLPKL